uniref:RdRp catalytic domain-containing protein n=2 Tax=Lygus hesperus TaxID=30085 RepID=A0A0K8T195_LYGHE
MLERNQGMDEKLVRQSYKNYATRFTRKHISPVCVWKIINSYSGGKRKMYMRAFDKIQSQGWDPKWSRIRMFVKPDRIPLNEVATKDPRGIQARDPAFNLAYSCFLKPIEHHIYQQEGTGPTKITNFAKGKNNVERAKHLQTKWRAFNNPVALNIDYKRFDSTIAACHLRGTHKIYKRFNNSKHFTKLMNQTIRNTGYTRGGIKYTIKGTRMSGDFDTGLGNSLVNDATLLTVFGHIKHEIYLDGDDSVVIIEQQDLASVDFDLFQRLGFEAKIQYAYHPHEIEFCQARLIDSEIPYLARNPFRTAAHLNVSVKTYSKNLWPSYNEARFYCEMLLSNGLPVIPHLCRNNLKGVKKYYDEDTKWVMENLVADDKIIQPTLQVRELYHLAFGINPEEQILLETCPNAFNELSVLSYRTKSKYKTHYAVESLSTTWQAWHSLGDSSSSSCWSRSQGCL